MYIILKLVEQLRFCHLSQDFGAIVMSDLILETRPCPQLYNAFAQPRGFMGVRQMVLHSAIEQEPGA